MMLSRNRHAVLVKCLARRTEPVAASLHFSLYTLDPSVNDSEWIIVHDFVVSQIDNNIGYYVANELLPLLAGRGGYHGSDQEVFERCVGEIVRSMDSDERNAWHLFYDNTLAGLLKGNTLNADVGDGQSDFIANFAAIYQRAIQLIGDLFGLSSQPISVLDVATCFGFFPLMLGKRREDELKFLADVVGCDLNPALVDLANDYARQRQLERVRFAITDILAERMQGPAFDVVAAIHLLEHLEPWQTSSALANLWDLTARRLIVAVPLEAVPDARFGHRQVFDRQRLVSIGKELGGSYEYFEERGGWLVIDRL